MSKYYSDRSLGSVGLSCVRWAVSAEKMLMAILRASTANQVKWRGPRPDGLSILNMAAVMFNISPRGVEHIEHETRGQIKGLGPRPLRD
eukprot:3969936-Amphidinium_carterae.1